MSPASSSNETTERDYVVVARRYRPRTFQELIGQEHVAQALAGAISSERVGHAYLFTGARGVGKTSAARILAKALNCVRGASPDPCNECEICRSISTGDDVDVLEIDGASNRGIDEIRQLRQNVAVRPSRARFKIYIIDEVHMLTKEAFNALLKTLEEPPEHVKFIFATTEPNKIPITILSRCQRYDFAGIDSAAIRDRLEQIAREEGVDATPEALQLIAVRASGSMRDSQSLLEQLLSTGAKSVSANDVSELLGLAPATRLTRLVQAMVARDAATAISELEVALAHGAEPGQLIDQLLGYFRDAMTLAVGCDQSQLLFVLPGQLEEIRHVAERLGVQSLLAICQILDQTASRLRLSTQVRTLTEMAVVRICRMEDLDALAALLEQLKASNANDKVVGVPTARRDKHADGKVDSIPADAKGADRRRPVAATDESPRTEASDAEPQPVARRKNASESSTTTDKNPESRDATSTNATISEQRPLNQQSAQSTWRQALALLSGLLADNAREATAVSVDRQGRLSASFPKSRAFSRDACLRPANLAKLESALAEAYGGPVRLALETHDDLPSEVAPSAQAPLKSRREQQMEASNDPLVQKAIELFESQPSTLKYVPPADQ